MTASRLMSPRRIQVPGLRGRVIEHRHQPEPYQGADDPQDTGKPRAQELAGNDTEFSP